MASARDGDIKRDPDEDTDEDVVSADENDDIHESDDVQMVAPRILAGQEDRQHWTTEGPCSGLRASVTEGALGKLMRRQAILSRTPEERFRFSVCKVSLQAQIPIPVRDGLIRLIPRIPDVGYKNAAGCLLGLMAIPYIGKKLSPGDRKKFDEILAYVDKIKDKNMRISELDVCRYARLMKRVTTGTTGAPL
jgi:hypothetical protein